jgi:hypothetical protein
MSLKLDTTEDAAFLMSGTADKLRQMLSAQVKAQSDTLLRAAMSSTDPEVKGLATALAAFRETLKLLQPPKDPSE